MSGVIEVPSLIAPLDGIYECLPDGTVINPNLEDTVKEESKGLNPFDHHSSQVSLVYQRAYSIVSNPDLATREAFAIAREIMKGRRYLSSSNNAGKIVRTAVESRFDKMVAPTIACTMAAVSTGNAIYTLEFFEPNISVEESLRLTREQIDRADLCQLQAYNTIRTGKVRDAYVEQVGSRVERILSRR